MVRYGPRTNLLTFCDTLDLDESVTEGMSSIECPITVAVVELGFTNT